jgi:hypothetical protein
MKQVRAKSKKASLDEIVERRRSHMRKAKKNKKDSSNTRPQELSDLLRQALQQPGASEFMAVYEHWKTLDDAARPYRRAIGMKRVISASNTSGSIVRRIIRE